MAVKIIVSAEELNKTMEYVSLISGTAPGKKKNDDIVPSLGSIKITAVSPKKDKSYMIMFECVGISECLLYRMEGKSFYSTEMATTIVDAKSFIALVKTFSNDVELVFEDKYLGINCNTSNYKVTTSNIEIPQLLLPEDAERIVFSTNFLVNAYRFCSVACAKNDKRGPVFRCIQINLKADGTAICYATDSHKLAKYVDDKAGSQRKTTILMTPNSIAHITEMCTDNEITFIPTPKGIYVTTPRFDYMCYLMSGSMPDCERIFSNFKPIQTVVVEKSKLMSAITRAIIFSGDNESLRIKIAMDKENIYVNADSVSGSGLDSVPLDSSQGNDDKGHYLSGISLNRILGSCPSDKISISTAAPLAPIMIGIPDSNNLYVMSAMR